MKSLGVGQVSRGYSGFSVDLERARGSEDKEGTQFAVGL